MSERVIINLSDYRRSLLECLQVGADCGLIPAFPFDAEFAEDVLKAVLEERTTKRLNEVLRRPQETRVPEVVARFAQLTLARQQVHTGQYDAMMARQLLLDCIDQYLAEGTPHAAARLFSQWGIPAQDGLTLVRQLTGLEINYSNPSESDEQYVAQIDNVLGYIEDLDILFRFNGLLDSLLSENPYETYHLKYLGGIVLVTRLGDHRILEWHRQYEP